MAEENEVHLVKKVSKELGLTYKELGEKIGYSESNLRGTVSQNKISKQLEKSIELYLETLMLKEELKSLTALKAILKSLVE